MQTASRLAIAYAVNSLWQLPLLFLAADIIIRLLGRTRGRVLCAVWWIALVLALVVPALAFVNLPHRGISDAVLPTHYANQNKQMSANPGPRRAISSPRGQVQFALSGARIESPRPFDRAFSTIPGVISTSILYLYLGSIVVAVVRLGRGLWQTHALIRSAQTANLNEELRKTWEASQISMGMTDVRIRSTAVLSSPATLHWPKPIVLIPSELESANSAEMNAVFCHELAHVFRKDFIWNLAIELVGVLLFYHPAFHWMRRRIGEARELACDDMAADAVRGRHDYARHLLRLTHKMLSADTIPQPGCVLGIFEGEVLERRIMNLLEKRSQHPVLRVVTSSILGTCLVILASAVSANFGLRPVNAQSAPQAIHAPSGWFLAGSKPTNYQTGVDRAAVNNDQPSAVLRSTVSNTEGFGTLMQSINATDYAGKRVRLRAWVKSEGVADWAGVWMRVDKVKTSVAFDNMQNRPIRGTQSWGTHDVVLDVPQDSTGISFGILLSGVGKVWINDVTFDIVGEDVPVTAGVPAKLPDHPANLKFTE